MGINFVISPTPTIDMATHMRFQQSLIDRGIEFGGITFKESEIAVERQEPNHLAVKVVATHPPAIGQLLIISPQAASGLGLFAREAEAVVEAFNSTWPSENQTISSDVTFRDIFETTAEHAFQELWEERLGRSNTELQALGWSIQAGGLRFVVPPNPDESDPVTIEMRIESFLRDPKKIWVQTTFKWIKPMPVEATMDPERQLRQVDVYIERTVVPFIMGGAQ
jgi:hypothetical protein